MALNASRLVGLTALGAAAIAVVLLPPSPDYWERPDVERWHGPPVARVDQLDRAVNRAQRRVRAAEVRELVRAALRKDPVRPGDLPRLRIEAAVSPGDAASLHASWGGLVTALGPYDRAAGLAVILLDRPSNLPPRHWHYLPETTDGRTCVAVVEIGGGQEPWGDHTQWLRRVIGPCAFYAAFGPPGAPLQEWMTAAAMRVASAPAWDEPAHVRAPRDLAIGPAGTAPADVAQRIASQMFYRSYLQGFDQTACGAGELEACRRYLAVDPLFAEPSWVSLGMPGIVWNRASLRQWYDPDVIYFLSDLVRLRGRDRFAEFWRAPAGVDSAFAGTYGLSLEQWTMEWVRQGQDVRVGPYVRRSSVLVSLLLTVLVVAAGAVFTTRRQVS